jgi:hypothetical protein
MLCTSSVLSVVHHATNTAVCSTSSIAVEPQSGIPRSLFRKSADMVPKTLTAVTASQ